MNTPDEQETSAQDEVIELPEVPKEFQDQPFFVAGMDQGYLF